MIGLSIMAIRLRMSLCPACERKFHKTTIGDDTTHGGWCPRCEAWFWLEPSEEGLALRWKTKGMAPVRFSLPRREEKA